MHAKPGMGVRAGLPLITLHTDTPERFGRAREALQGAYAIGDAAPDERPLILERIA
jgi:thymidine phosphorylase